MKSTAMFIIFFIILIQIDLINFQKYPNFQIPINCEDGYCFSVSIKDSTKCEDGKYCPSERNSIYNCSAGAYSSESS